MIPKDKKKILTAVLSLSLLTVMVGAAVAPALGVIRAYFADADPTLVQMIISIPALFIVITNLLFPKMAKKMSARTLVIVGLVFYTFGGCAAGLFSNIYAVLAARALVGVGVGMIMPLSTGLLAFYFDRKSQSKLMGYSSAMNQMGGVIATLLSGLLATISWRASFLVYLMGLTSLVLCLAFVPADNIHPGVQTDETSKASKPSRASRTDALQNKGAHKEKYGAFIAAMFFLMMTFFIYPANFAMITAENGVIPQHLIAVIMAFMDLIAFGGGLLFARMHRKMGDKTRFVSPLLFIAGYGLLMAFHGYAGTIGGSALIGFANGAGIPYIISTVSMKAGKNAGTTVMPLISAALYLAQFTTPVVTSAATTGLAYVGVAMSPFALAAATGVLFLACSVKCVSSHCVETLTNEDYEEEKTA